MDVVINPADQRDRAGAAVSDSSQDAAERVEAAAGPRFRLPIYEGPLDLLLHLIKRAELDAHDVTASIITEQYLAYLELLDSAQSRRGRRVPGDGGDAAADQVVLAAAPSRAARSWKRPRNSSATWSSGCSSISAIARPPRSSARARFLGRDVFAAPGEKLPEPPPEEEAGAPRLNVSLFDLVEAMAAVLKRLTDTAPRQIALRDIPVAECIPRIMAALEQSGGPVEFAALFEDFRDPTIVRW